MGKGAVIRPRGKALVAERIVRCPRCEIKLAEAKGGARVTGLAIKCRRCHLTVYIEI